LIFIDSPLRWCHAMIFRFHYCYCHYAEILPRYWYYISPLA
jgi:hypothetical protein